jgi:Rad3-related DNA helicase
MCIRDREYTVHAPACRRILQAMGRMIRSEDERGICFIIDRRAIHFRESIPDMRIASSELSEMSAFFSPVLNEAKSLKRPFLTGIIQQGVGADTTGPEKRSVQR